eukprot:CAMPEP_0179411008 /NCGR_PEP_ID=MMETSP0799-20121207/3654_1 /TAXON_ID=46947 /ORGANISM="Geminigera cryophila, Strain CCMP2564" /LENGTH=386 /DNA_ID=CAMNT_0021183021 /DNA_START=42 /DNA_END=1202 /DNA_ORIENTATION=-
MEEETCWPQVAGMWKKGKPSLSHPLPPLLLPPSSVALPPQQQRLVHAKFTSTLAEARAFQDALFLSQQQSTDAVVSAATSYPATSHREETPSEMQQTANQTDGPKKAESWTAVASKTIKSKHGSGGGASGRSDVGGGKSGRKPLKFCHMESTRYLDQASGRQSSEGVINVLDGLLLYQDIINQRWETELIEWIEECVRLGLSGQLAGETFMQSTYTDHATGKRGRGRQVLQYGSYYDYANHRIAPEVPVEPLHPILLKLVDKLVHQGVLPQAVRPDSAIINLYRPGDNIPPHIDHMDYPRPFSTLSLLSDADMLLGAHIEPRGNGTFRAPCTINLSRRSLLILAGNGANVAKHCIPAVQSRRISITLRRLPTWAREARDAAFPPPL